jgi:hypothetical protein
LQLLEDGVEAVEDRGNVERTPDKPRLNQKRDAIDDRQGDGLAAFAQKSDGGGWKAQLSKGHVTADGVDMILAIIRSRAGASRSRHKAFRDQVSNLSLHGAGTQGEFVDVQRTVLLST